MEAWQCALCPKPVRLTNNEIAGSTQGISALVCGHISHTLCVKKCLKKSLQKSCPKCSVDLRKGSSTPFTLYLNLEYEHPSETSKTHPEPEKKDLKVEAAETIIKRRERERCAALETQLESSTILHANSQLRIEATKAQMSEINLQLKDGRHELSKNRGELKKLEKIKNKLVEEARDNLLRYELNILRLNSELRSVMSETERLKNAAKNSGETSESNSTDPAGINYENIAPPPVLQVLRSDHA